MVAESTAHSPLLGVGESAPGPVLPLKALPVSAEDRGATTIPAEVVAKIASQAASEVAHIGAAAGGVLGVGSRRRFTARPDAECELYNQSAVLRLEVGCDFPVPLVEVMTDLRDHVTRRVESLTGIEVGRMDVEVSWLNPVDRTRRALR